MEQSKNLPTPEPATDEPGSSPHSAALEPRRFVTEAEQAAYRAGLADAGRDRGGAPARHDFEPVAARYRQDGLTPAKQRDYLEALADCGIGREAAARVGVSERSVARLRRRADAGSFNIACEATRRFGARRLHSIAWERAIEGTTRQHYYHGELKGEERVFDNRLLVYLLGKTEHLVAEPHGAGWAAEHWQPYVEAIGQGAPPPDPWAPEPEAEQTAEELEEELAAGLKGDEVWEEDGIWWTSFPPPEDYDGWEHEMFGEEGYMRTLTAAEQAVAEAESDEESDQALGEAEALRDFYFGFEGGRADRGEEEDGAGEEDEEDEAGEEENGTGETGDGDGEGEFISSREAGLSGPFEPSGEEAAAPAAATAAGEAAPAAAAAAAEEAPPPATAQLYEPSWLRYE